MRDPFLRGTNTRVILHKNNRNRKHAPISNHDDGTLWEALCASVNSYKPSTSHYLLPSHIGRKELVFLNNATMSKRCHTSYGKTSFCLVMRTASHDPCTWKIGDGSDWRLKLVASHRAIAHPWTLLL